MLNLADLDCPEVRAPVNDGRELAIDDIDHQRDALGSEGDHTIGTLDHGLILPLERVRERFTLSGPGKVLLGTFPQNLTAA
jgi:hypothetical protein